MERPMIKYSGINHLAMVTKDMDATIRYWRDLLGMRLVAGLGERQYRHYFFEISEQDLIAFFEWPDVEMIDLKDHGVPVKGAAAFDHVAISVVDLDGLRSLRKKLFRAGFWVSEIIDHGFIHSIYSFDPNNIPVEFCCNIPGVDIRKRPKMEDRNPSDVTLEGAEPQPNQWETVDDATDLDETIYPGEGTVFRQN